MQTRKKKKREKEDDILERLEQENRELKAQVRSLTKHIKKLSRSNHIKDVEEIFDSVVDSLEDREDNKKCTECGKGYIVTITLGPRKQLGCNTCGWRGKITK